MIYEINIYGFFSKISPFAQLFETFVNSYKNIIL